MARTLEQIRREGIAALCERLGRSGMVRFMQQYELGHGDYSRERHAWVDQTSLKQLRALAKKRQDPHRKKKR